MEFDLGAADHAISMIRRRMAANQQLADHFTELVIADEHRLDGLIEERERYLGSVADRLSNVVLFPTEQTHPQGAA